MQKFPIQPVSLATLYDHLVAKKANRELKDTPRVSRKSRMQVPGARYTVNVDLIASRRFSHTYLRDAFAPRAQLQLYAKVARCTPAAALTGCFNFTVNVLNERYLGLMIRLDEPSLIIHPTIG